MNKITERERSRPIVRKAAFAGFSWFAGIALGGYDNAVLSAAAAVLMLFAAVRLWGRRTAALCAVSAVLGAAYVNIYTAAVYRPVIALACSEALFQGKITAVHEYGSDSTGYEVSGTLGGIRNVKLIIYSDSKKCRAGDSVSASGKISPIRDSYTFPAKSYYMSRDIFVRMNAKDFEIVPYDGFSLRRLADRCSGFVSDVISETLPGEEGKMLCAMLTGDKSGMEDGTRIKLYRAGCGHIMTVSGIHLTVLYAVIAYILGMTGLFGRRDIFLICIPIVIFFCVIAGFSKPVIRAAVMLFILNSGSLIGRKSDAVNSLGLAGIVLTAISPYAVYDSGMILSFAGVIGISVISPRISERICKAQGRTGKGIVPESIIKAAAGAFSVSMAVFPFTLFIYDEASLISPVTNIIILPLCTAALIIGGAGAALGAVPFISKPLLLTAGLLCRPVLAWADAVYTSKMFFIPSDSAAVRYLSAVICFSAAALLMFYDDITRAVTISLTAVMLGITAVTVYHAALPEDSVSFVCLSGNNCAAAVIHNGHTASVFDIYGGGRSAAMCEKYLRRKGISGIDMLFLADKPLSAYSVYAEEFELYDTASVFCAGESAGDAVTITEGTTLDTGYAVFSYDDEKLAFTVNGERLAVFTESADAEEEYLFTAVCGKGNVLRSDAEYAAAFCGGEYEDRAEGYPCDDCIEIKISPEKTKAEVIFDGGGD